MGNFDHNRFDRDFAHRLLLSMILCPVVIVLISIIGSPLAHGSVIGFSLVMAVVCIAIALVGNYLKLIPFPLIKALHDDLPEGEADALRRTLWKTFSVLPLSFAAAAIWIVLFEMAVGPFGGTIFLILIGPVTQITMIVHLASRTLTEGLNKSCKAVLLMVFVHFVVSPALPEAEVINGETSAQEHPW